MLALPLARDSSVQQSHGLLREGPLLVAAGADVGCASGIEAARSDARRALSKKGVQRC